MPAEAASLDLCCAQTAGLTKVSAGVFSSVFVLWAATERQNAFLTETPGEEQREDGRGGEGQKQEKNITKVAPAAHKH